MRISQKTKPYHLDWQALKDAVDLLTDFTNTLNDHTVTGDHHLREKHARVFNREPAFAFQVHGEIERLRTHELMHLLMANTLECNRVRASILVLGRRLSRSEREIFSLEDHIGFHQRRIT